MKNVYQHGAPVHIKDGKTSRLKNIRLGHPSSEATHREEFLQNLVHEHPEIIPIDQIEPAFSPLMSVCKELPTSAGYLDNLWVTPAGALVLGECKLVRNPQARRELVTQGLDYARAISEWHFDDLQAAVRKATKKSDVNLWDFVKDQNEGEEHTFVDAVERRLRSGALMVLLICDGIHEGAEALVSHLQMHAGVHAGLALLDLSIWEGADGALLIVPRVPLRTVLIERGIVRVDNSIARIDPPGSSTSEVLPQATRPVSASEPEFYTQMAARFPDLPSQLSSFIESLKDIGIQPEFGKSLFLKWQSSSGAIFSSATIEPNGSVWLGRTATEARNAGNPTAGERYLQDVAGFIGGTLRRNGNSLEIRDAFDKAPKLFELLAHAAEWKAAIGKLISSLEDA